MTNSTWSPIYACSTENDGADWTDVARIVLHLDPDREPERARRAWETHLARARWMTEHGYRHLLWRSSALTGPTGSSTIPSPAGRLACPQPGDEVACGTGVIPSFCEIIPAETMGRVSTLSSNASSREVERRPSSLRAVGHRSWPLRLDLAAAVIAPS